MFCFVGLFEEKLFCTVGGQIENLTDSKERGIPALRRQGGCLMRPLLKQYHVKTSMFYYSNVDSSVLP